MRRAARNLIIMLVLVFLAMLVLPVIPQLFSMS